VVVTSVVTKSVEEMKTGFDVVLRPQTFHVTAAARISSASVTFVSMTDKAAIVVTQVTAVGAKPSIPVLPLVAGVRVAADLTSFPPSQVHAHNAVLTRFNVSGTVACTIHLTMRANVMMLN